MRAAIAATGRDAILRGAGAGGTASPSAVAILENFEARRADDDGAAAPAVAGLARMVQVAPGATAVDVGLGGAARGRWTVSVRRSGDVRGGRATVGAVWGRDGPAGEGAKEADAQGGAKGGGDDEEGVARGWIADVEVGADGRGETVAVAPFGVDEVLGRALLVERSGEKRAKDEADGRRADREPVMGVIARSAGAWENDKTVCSCSGKTVWEERREQKERGMP